MRKKQEGGMMEKNLPAVVLEWVQCGKISLAHLPDNSLGSVKENAEFLRDLCGLRSKDLGRLLFPDSASDGSQQTQATKTLSRGSLREVARVPVVLGFNQSIVFTNGLRQKVIDHVKSLGDPTWEESVFSLLPTCSGCGTASLTVRQKFCANCGNKL
jgi:hypothetical protein